MNPEPKNIERIQRIIALKRFEQPPPGYFHVLPDRIMTRIERGEGGSDFWEKVFSIFSVRPALAYAFAVSVCGAVTISTMYATRIQGSVASGPDTGLALNMSSQMGESQPTHARVLHVQDWLGSTNPVVAVRDDSSSLFGAPEAHAVSVSYHTGF